MPRKMVRFDSVSLDALGLLASDARKSFQDLIDEAVSDLLKKHRRPTTTADMFRQSLDRTAKAPPPASRLRR